MNEGERVPSSRLREVLLGQGGAQPKLSRPAHGWPRPVREPFPTDVGLHEDLTRILALPRGETLVADEPGRFRVPGGTMRLRSIQDSALNALYRAGGLLGAIPVGHGKTLIGLLAPVVLGAIRPLLLIPAQLRDQTARDIERYGAHFSIAKPLVRSYEELSNPAHSGMLSVLVPDLIIADECHKLRYFTSARVRRVARYLREHPECRFVALSGTITRGALADFAHLAAWALGRESPLPLGEALLSAWDKALVEGNRREPSLAQIRRRAGGIVPRKAVQDHLAKSKGVVLTGGDTVACSLVIHERSIEAPRVVLDAIDKVWETWQSPDGDELESALDLDRVLSQLACGFYYYWDWSPEPWNGDPDVEWLERRAVWHRAVRQVLQSEFAAESLDSPMLLASACARAAKVPEALAKAWQGWVPVKGRDPPPVLAEWIDPFRVDDAIEWARAQDDPPLLWYAHRVVGDELARRSGWIHFGEGPESSVAIAKVAKPATAIVSLQAHGHGKNLQVWGNQGFVDSIRSASTL